jgi:molybdate transport system ATP-binding protein
VLLLDEPFAAVDRSVRRRLQDEVDNLRRTLHLPLILVTHDFEDVIRIATHVVLLERGRTVGHGPLSSLTSRPDLPWLREAIGLGSVFEATVSDVDIVRGLAALTFDGGNVRVPARGLTAKTAVRVRIPARDIILATAAPTGLSLHNVLSGTVTAMHADAAFDTVIVQLVVGRTPLLAEVTRDAVEALDIDVGHRLYALIKSVSIECVVAGSSPDPPTG